MNGSGIRCSSWKPANTGRYIIRNLQVLAGSAVKTASPAKRSAGSKQALYPKLTKKRQKRLIRWGIIAANFAIVAIVGMIAFATHEASPTEVKAVQNEAAFSAISQVKPLDSLSSADVAVHVARMTGMQEATAVVNKADSVNAQLAVAASDDAVVAKPQIVGAGLKSKKDIKDYTVQEGDTIPSLAEKFGITADTIRISNGLSGDALEVGKVIAISPINGVVYTVKDGDTPDSLATKYFANKENLLIFNDAELTGAFKVGERIVIPDGVQPAAPAPARVASYSGGYGYGFSFGTSAIYGANGYDYGWCTWHAANRRNEIGRPIPNNLGNAISWLSVARGAGLPTGDVPQAGAVLYHKNLGGLGHVAFVEKINEDGSALVSDMNYPIWGSVTYRTVPPAEFGNYAFIY